MPESLPQRDRRCGRIEPSSNQTASRCRTGRGSRRWAIKPPSVTFMGATLVGERRRGSSWRRTTAPTWCRCRSAARRCCASGCSAGARRPTSMAIAFDARPDRRTRTDPAAARDACSPRSPSSPAPGTSRPAPPACSSARAVRAPAPGRIPRRACQASSRDVRSLSDFANAATRAGRVERPAGDRGAAAVVQRRRPSRAAQRDRGAPRAVLASVVPRLLRR